MKKITITRQITIPDVARIQRFQRLPELGPKILFFSGGTAINDISKYLKHYTHNSIHLVTPFDSGGSSAILRTAFHMPAVGDLRSRMMALADETISGQPEIFRLFAYRLPNVQNPKSLLSKLMLIAAGKDDLIHNIKKPMRNLICTHLHMFLKNMPHDFDLRGASIGNLIIAGAYLNNRRKLDQVIFMFSKFINVQGQVSTVVNDDLHLAAVLENGETIIGQHLLTAKEASPLTSAIKELYYVKKLTDPTPIEVIIKKKTQSLIAEAEFICYPPGSFFTSLAANLLPKGVGRAISKNPCSKFYIPSLGNDPECLGMSLDDNIFQLIHFLRKDAGVECPVDKLLNFIFIDPNSQMVLQDTTKAELKKMKVHVVETPLVSPESTPYYDPQLLIPALLSFC
jgi:CofD-related protein of GAK system